MKKWTVRLEFDVDSIDFGDIVVKANSPEEAKLKAMDDYYSGTQEIDYYSSNYYDSTLRTQEMNEWYVEEKNDD